MSYSFTEGDNDAQAVIEEAALLKAARINIESYWQETSEVVLPSFSQTFSNNLLITPYAKKDQKRFDGRAEVALYRFSSAMESMLTPRGGMWHALATSDPSLNQKPRVRQYFDTVTDILFRLRYAPMANFGSQCHEYYTSLGAFGTSAMYIDKLDQAGGGFRYSTQHIANVYFADNHQGIVNRAIRPFRMTARNAVAKFKGNVPDAIKVAAAGPNPMQLFDFFHCVKPNENQQPNYKDWRGMKFTSYYVSVQGQATCLKEGFNSFPYMISRYMTAPGELYGRSPAMQVLTNIKVLNEQKKTVLKQGQRIVDPVLLAHDDGVLDGFSLKPGAVNPGAINSRGQRLVDVLPTGNISVGFEMMEMEGKEISSAFLTDLFQILVDGPQMTATEILERAREKGALLSPTMGRQESEFLGFMIEREIDLGVQQRLLPDMPPELIEAGGEYKIIYDNPLSRAQKAEQTAGAMRVIQWAAEFAQMTQNPEPLDHFDFDVIIPDLAANQAVPFRYMATAEKLKAIRDGRAQQTAIQQTIQAGPSVAALATSQGNKIQ